MPLTFLNGGSPNYTGFQFTSTSGLLTEIESTLNTAGWTTISSSSTELFIRGNSIIGNYPCFIDFVVSGTSPNLTLTMRAWQESTKTTGSPAGIHTLTFTNGQINRLWLTANEEAGCVCIFNQNGASVGIHFGFLARYETTDANAWMIGRLHSSGYLYAYVAKSKFNNTNWRQLSLDYNQYGNDPYNPPFPNAPLQLSTFDLLARIGFTSPSPFTNTTSTNVGYLAYNGIRNYDGNCVIDPYLYIEGRGGIGNYGSTPYPYSLFVRGLVQFGFCGVANLQAGQYCNDPITGNKILSVGGLQWQGMRIL